MLFFFVYFGFLGGFLWGFLMLFCFVLLFLLFVFVAVVLFCFWGVVVLLLLSLLLFVVLGVVAVVFPAVYIYSIILADRSRFTLTFWPHHYSTSLPWRRFQTPGCPHTHKQGVTYAHCRKTTR